MIIVFVGIGLYCIYSYVCELRNSDPDYVLSEEIKKNPIIAEVKKDIDTYGEIRCQVNIPRVKLVCAILRIYPQITMTDACELVNKYYHKHAEINFSETQTSSSNKPHIHISENLYLLKFEEPVNYYCDKQNDRFFYYDANSVKIFIENQDIVCDVDTGCICPKVRSKTLYRIKPIKKLYMLKRYEFVRLDDGFGRIQQIYSQEWELCNKPEICSLIASIKLKYISEIANCSQNLHIDKEYYESKIRGMQWRQFEIFIQNLFMKKGYETILTPPANDGGKDIIVKKDGLTYFIECKHWKKESVIGREYLQKLVGAAVSHNVRNVIFIATCTYNDNAIEYAKKLNSTDIHIELWGMNRILQEVDLLTKF